MKKVGNAVLVFFGIVVLIGLARGGCGAQQSTTSTPSPEPAAARADLPQLESQFTALRTAGVVAGIDTDHGTPWIMAGRGFHALTYEEKERAAQLISDYWAAVKGGAPGSAVAYEIHDQYSGEKLYEWNGIKLKR